MLKKAHLNTFLDIMFFQVNDNRLLKKYTKILEKVSILMNIELDSKPVCGDNGKYMKAKIKSIFKEKENTKRNTKRKCTI